MVWFWVRHERQHGVGGALTLAGRCRSDVPLGSCREEPGLFAEQWIQVLTPPHSGGTQIILLRRATSIRLPRKVCRSAHVQPLLAA